MKKILSTIFLPSLFVLAIAPSAEAHRVNSRKACEKYAEKHLDMTCDQAIAAGLITLAF